MATFPTPRSAYYGNPATPEHQPDKADLVRVFEQVQAIATTQVLTGFVGAFGSLPTSGNTLGDTYAVMTADDTGGIYEWDEAVWVKISTLPVTLTTDEFALVAQAWAESSTAPDPDIPNSKSSKTWALAAGASADAAAVYASSAELAAIAAGASIYADTTAGLAATVSGDVFLVPDANGMIVYENDTGVAVSLGRFRPAVFDSISEMATSSGATDQQFATVSSGTNGEPGGFQYVAASALTADGALIVDATGMGVGQWISQRTDFSGIPELIGDKRSNPVGAILKTPLYSYIGVSSGAQLAQDGGLGLQLLGRNNLFPMLGLAPNADGVTDDKTKIDLLNTSGTVVDLGGKDYEYGGVFSAAASFINGRIIDDNRTYDYLIKTHETVSTVGQSRERINYNTPTGVRVDGLPDSLVMGGFYSFGQYLGGKGRIVGTGLGANSHAIVPSTSVVGLTSADDQNWYAVFAVANDEEATCRFVWVPYFRCFSIAGNVITLGRGDENQNITPATKTYTMGADAFAGAECLVITEGGQVSRRITTITSNTATTITLADATGIAQLDFILPAPPNEDSYHYLGSFLFESPNSIRNLADNGYEVRGRMVTLSEVQSSGAASNNKLRFGGMISPLATGVVGSLNESLSTASTGGVSETLAHDGSSHDIWRCLFYKEGTGAFGGNNMFTAVFSKEQALWHTTGGAISTAVVARTMLIYGWFE